MEYITKILDEWEPVLKKEVNLGGLFTRDPVAHKWKVTYRVVVLRELVFWRSIDLLRQMVLLAENNHILGARILLRSSLETIAVLVYLNVKMQDVVEGKIPFHEFCEKVLKLMLGSKDKSTSISSINVVTIVTKHCERKYPGIAKIYADLSESAHPNYEGICNGYSKVDERDYSTHFGNRWSEIYGDNLETSIFPILKILEDEFNDVFVSAFNALEEWLVLNDERLGSEKDDF